MITTRITDLITRKNVQEYYKIYEQSQWYDEQQMKALQLNKLQKLIKHCYVNVPYYQKVMRSIGVKPDDAVNLDIIQIFPILTKEIIKDNYKDFIPQNLSGIKGVKTSQTGGTTGNILFKRNDANTRSSVWATFKRFHTWMGVKEGDKTLVLMGGHVIGRNFKDHFKLKVNSMLANSISFSPYDTSEANLAKIENYIRNKNFVLIRSYSQFLFSLAKRFHEKGIKTNIKAITTTAEPLMPEHRRLFKKVFNSEVFDQYGCGEIGGVAYECEHHNGLHIADERVIVETNDSNELIITDLDNYAMPFIRYWNADQAIIENENCTCGRRGRLIKSILGRTCDYIIGVNGEYLHWAYFWHLFFDSQLADKRNLRKFQVIQSKQDEIIIRLVCDGIDEDDKALLTSNIQSRLGKIRIKYVLENDIENSQSGKYRPVINRLL